ncbi:MAG TPA: dihydroorotase family protein [Candidatus Peribacterales bacterium]|nr:dihydroorotase family protein [Candidatus Peribacterales bacterium]
MSTLLIKNGMLVTDAGEKSSDVLIRDGIIEALAPKLSDAANECVDAGNLLLFPGLIDCHVHFREPGYEDAEDMETGAAAARSGGVTTVCDMPNTNPPTSTRAALDDKLRRAEKIRECNIRFFFNVSSINDLAELAASDRKHMVGVKLYFDHSTGNLGADEEAINGAFQFCSERNITIVVHAEDAATNEAARKLNTQSDIAAHSAMRPPESEMEAVDEAIMLAKKYGTALHIAHLSTRFGLNLVRQAKADRLPVTCEVAPHHLFLTVEDYKTLGTFGKMNPPLRTRDHAEALWEGIGDRTVDCIATDHAPHTLARKNCEHPLEAPSGVPGVETMLPLLLSCMESGPEDGEGNLRPMGGTPETDIQPQDILRLCFTNPNRIFHLGKPGIVVGKPADIALVNPGQSWKIHGKALHSKCGWTPYEGWRVIGKVIRVI